MDSEYIIKGAVQSLASPWELENVLKGDERVLLREFQQQQDLLIRRFWEQLPSRLGAARVEEIYIGLYPETQRSIGLHAYNDAETARQAIQREHAAKLRLLPNN